LCWPLGAHAGTSYTRLARARQGSLVRPPCRSPRRGQQTPPGRDRSRCTSRNRRVACPRTLEACPQGPAAAWLLPQPRRCGGEVSPCAFGSVGCPFPEAPRSAMVAPRGAMVGRVRSGGACIAGHGCIAGLVPSHQSQPPALGAGASLDPTPASRLHRMQPLNGIPPATRAPMSRGTASGPSPYCDRRQCCRLLRCDGVELLQLSTQPRRASWSSGRVLVVSVPRPGCKLCRCRLANHGRRAAAPSFGGFACRVDHGGEEVGSKCNGLGC
jgi:hypothetical protein